MLRLMFGPVFQVEKKNYIYHRSISSLAKGI